MKLKGENNENPIAGSGAEPDGVRRGRDGESDGICTADPSGGTIPCHGDPYTGAFTYHVLREPIYTRDWCIYAVADCIYPYDT